MANLTNSAKLIAEMEKKANLTDLPDVYDSTVTVVVNWNTGSNTFSTNQSSNSTLKVTVWKSDVGLWNVDNTSDANKPISTATQAALDLKADKSDISSVYKYKWSVANYESLPSSWQTVWDVYNVEAAHTTAPKFDAGANVAWDGTAWDVLGWNVDLSNYPTNSDVLTKTNTTSFTPSWDYQPATKKYVDDSVSSIEPSNTKTFFLPWVWASQSVLTVAQAAWDRYKAWKDPIIFYDNKAYTVFAYQWTWQTALTFASSGVWNKDGNSDSNRMFALIRIIASSDVVSYVSSTTNDTPWKYLRTDYNYSTPYTPTYNGSPATKKYVDDTIASAKSSWATAPSNPTEWQLWYDTTNDQLKVYDWTNWNVVWDDSADVNTKTFYISSTNDTTTAQAIYDWYNNGKNPIVIYWNNSTFILYDANWFKPSRSPQTLLFRSSYITEYNNRNAWYSQIALEFLRIVYDSHIDQYTITLEQIPMDDKNRYLNTNKNYSTPYTPVYPWSPATKKYVDDNIKIYNAWTWISISNIIKNWRQWPAPDWFHVPASSERESVKSILVTTFWLTSSSSTLQDYLKMPAAGERNYTDSSVKNQWTIGYYRSTTPNGNQVASMMNFGSNSFYPKNNNSTGYACSIRCFKDTAISPDSRWEILYDGSSIATWAWVFYNSLLWLISLSWDWITWITIQDKNLWATTVYNNWDILSEANCWKYYQWGNNYWFPRASDATITTSSTKVNASNYWPWNYYSSDTFIINNAWDSSNNQDLWWNTTSTFTVKNGITNTWVLSVNWQTGDVTIQWWGWHDYSWETATISSWAVTLWLRTVVEPTSNFTLNAPSNLEDGMEYVLRCVNWSTAYTLTLGTWFVNDFSTDLTLHANHSDQFTFVAYDWTLELQPDYATKDYVDDMIWNIETLLSNI